MSDLYLPVNLPSKCLPYSEVSSNQIRVRPFNGADEILLAQINLINLESKFCEVLSRVVDGIDPNKITVGDRLYLMLWLCINSYTETMNFDTICSHCLKPSVISVDLRKIKNQEIPEDFVPIKEIEATDGTKLQIRLLNLGDLAEVERYELEHGEGSGHLMKYALCVEDGTPLEKRIERLGNLKPANLAMIRAYQRKYAHGPIMLSNQVCPLCGKEEVFELPFRLEILFPFGEALTDGFGERI